MYRYSGFSLTIESQVELPEFPQGYGDPELTIRLGGVRRVHKWASIDDEVAFPRNVGGFRVARGHEIVVDLLPGADRGVVRTLLAGRLMAYLLRQRGYLPLHASAIAIDGHAVLFLGESGSGKSTTAAAFHARGHAVLADDVAAVRTTISGIELQSAWPGLRLLEDGRSVLGPRARSAGLHGDKHFYPLGDPAVSGSCPVKKIYFLEYENTDGQSPVHSFPLAGFSAVTLLNTHSFLRTWRAGHALRQINLDRAASVAAALTVCRLVRPRSLHLLPDLVDFVEKDLLAND